MSLIYKVCSNSEWEKALEEGFYKGSEIDIKDGYIHFSTKEQLKETVDKHFKKQQNLIIITFKVTDLVENIMWEQEPLDNLKNMQELVAYKHSGFWKSMDSMKDKNELEKIWKQNQIWKNW